MDRGQIQPLLLPDLKETGKELGRGAYGVVTEVIVSGTTCAAKKLHDVIIQGHTLRRFGDEVLLHSQQRHPNIVQLIGVYYPPRSQLPMLVMEYLPLSLTQCLEREELPLQMKYSILVDVAKGLCYLHGKRPPIVHRDLTANNVLLTSSYSAKISDLGVSRLADTFKKHHLTTAPGNAMVMPPEALEDNPVYDHKLDVFSYGCLILHVLTGQFPEPTNQFVPVPGRVKSFKKVQEWDRRSKYIEQIPKENELIPLAQKCLNNDPKYRPDMIVLAQKLSKLKNVDLEVIETGVRALAVTKEEENTASVTQVMYTLVVQHEKKGVGYWITTFSVVRDIKLYNENTHFADKERGLVFTFQYNQPNGVLQASIQNLPPLKSGWIVHPNISPMEIRQHVVDRFPANPVCSCIDIAVYAKPGLALEPLHCPVKITGIIPEITININRPPLATSMFNPFTQQTFRKHEETAACQALVDNNLLIKNAHLNLQSLAQLLLSKRIINDTNMKELGDRYTGLTADERMDKLLDIVKATIHVKGEVFFDFLEMIKQEDSIRTDELVKKLHEDYKILFLKQQ